MAAPTSELTPNLASFSSSDTSGVRAEASPSRRTCNSCGEGGGGGTESTPKRVTHAFWRFLWPRDELADQKICGPSFCAASIYVNIHGLPGVDMRAL